MTFSHLDALIVDESPFFCEYLASILKKLGFNHVWIEANVEKAKQFLEKKQPFLVFIETIQKGSLELFDYIKAIYPEITVVAMLRVKDPGLIETVLNKGSSCFLIKPFTTNEIKRIIEYSFLTKVEDVSKQETLFLKSMLPHYVRFVLKYCKNLGFAKSYEFIQNSLKKISTEHKLISYNTRTKTIKFNDKDDNKTLSNKIKIISKEIISGIESIFYDQLGNEKANWFLSELYTLFFLTNYTFYPLSKIFLGSYTSVDFTPVEKTLNQYFNLQDSLVVLNPQQIEVIAFKSDMLGISPAAKAGAKILSEREEIKYGSFLSAATALGSEYYTGLFGPVPVSGNPEFLSIYYTEILKDPNSPDPRLQNRNYVLVSLIYHKSMNQLFNNRLPLEYIFKNNLKPEDFIEKIDNKLMKKILNEIIQTYKKTS